MNSLDSNSGFPEPFFLDGSRGRVFAVYFKADSKPRGSILYMPPFAEEMNRCRHIVAEQARLLMDLGYSCLLLDPYGTGDSEGDLTDASWSTWISDVQTAAEWLDNMTGAPVILWGLRLGALLAVEVANKNPGRFARLVFWQPVFDGRLFLAQYLRLRVAYLIDNNLPPETTDMMRAKLQSGQTIEVAGYTLSERLVSEIECLRLGARASLVGKKIDWFEHIPELGRSPGLASTRFMTELEQSGCDLNIHTFVGAPIWQLHKRESIPDLVKKTTLLFEA